MGCALPFRGAAFALVNVLAAVAESDKARQDGLELNGVKESLLRIQAL